MPQLSEVRQPITYKRILFTLIALSLCSYLKAQERQADSLRQIKRNLLSVYSEKEVFNLRTLDSSGGKRFDSSLDLYHRFNPVYKHMLSWQDQAAIGSPVQDLSRAFEQGSGFRLTTDALSPWWYSSNEPTYYTSPLAVTDLNYAQGPPNMLYLEALHTQNVRAGWNVGVQYRHSAANNLYFDNLPNRDRTRMVSLFSTRLFSHYIRPDSQYIATFNLHLDRNTIQESGGIESLERFELNSGRLREFNNFARMGNASNRFNRNLIRFKQTLKKGLPITHQLELGRDMNRFDFIHNGSFFPEPIFSDVTFDSLRHFYASNKLSTGAVVQHWNITSSVAHAYHSISQSDASKGLYNNLSYNLRVEREKQDSTALFAEWEHFISGYNSGDVKLEGGYEKDARFGKLKLHAYWQLRRPDFLSNFFLSNHYLWRFNNWSKENIYSGSLSYTSHSESIGIQINATQVDNRMYFDTSGLPVQAASSWRFAQVQGYGQLKFGWFSSKPQVLLQTQNITLTGIPALAFKWPIAFNFHLFEKNLKVQLGADVWGHSAFALNYYNPITRRYQLSTHDVGWQLRINPFINLQVQSVRAFVMYERLNDLSGQAVYSSAFMPDMPAQLRFGIGWMLYN